MTFPSERCPKCSFNPTSHSDYCDDHRPGRKTDAQLLVELAVLTMAVLDAQQWYFKTRSKNALVSSKKLEKDLRAAANEALDRAKVTGQG